jgi:hypothetical protein
MSIFCCLRPQPGTPPVESVYQRVLTSSPLTPKAMLAGAVTPGSSSCCMVAASTSATRSTAGTPHDDAEASTFRNLTDDFQEDDESGAALLSPSAQPLIIFSDPSLSSDEYPPLEAVDVAALMLTTAPAPPEEEAAAAAAAALEAAASPKAPAEQQAPPVLELQPMVRRRASVGEVVTQQIIDAGRKESASLFAKTYDDEEHARLIDAREYHEVYPGLFVGGHGAPKAVHYLDGSQSASDQLFDLVVNADGSGGGATSTHPSVTGAPDSIIILGSELGSEVADFHDDRDAQEDFGVLLRAIDKIRACLQRRGSVLLQCRHGVNQSAAVAAALMLAEHDGLAVTDAQAFIRSRRRLCLRQERKWQEQLKRCAMKLKWRVGRKPMARQKFSPMRRGLAVRKSSAANEMPSAPLQPMSARKRSPRSRAQQRTLQGGFFSSPVAFFGNAKKMDRTSGEAENSMENSGNGAVNENGSPLLRALGVGLGVSLLSSATKKSPDKEN